MAILATGFRQISDDDYARTSIAELFAHAPRLDPSGTSWLPFPFWVTGAAMLAFGRTLAVARAVAVASSAAATAVAYVALRRAGVERLTAIGGVVLAAATPWNAWLGAATVPEGSAAALVAAGTITLAMDRPPWWGAVALVAASLARYEAWPACACFTAVAAYRAARAWRAAAEGAQRYTADAAIALLPMLGPLAWMAWNAHAHGSATHFLARVAAYRRAIGAAAAPLAEQIAVYPRALVDGAPDVIAVASLGIVAFCMFRDVRARWGAPLAAAVATLAFLIAGQVGDGAPTHHPERAVTPIFWVLAPFGVDGVRRLAVRYAWTRSGREAWAAALVSGAALFWALGLPARWRDGPGRSPAEDRSAQIARGDELRRAGVRDLAITPCAFEHFALLAAYGAPERASIAKATGAPVTPACPRVESR